MEKAVLFIRKIVQAAVDFSFNSSAYGVTREVMSQRNELDTLFLLLILGDSVGVPVFRSYYSYQLFPHLLLRLAIWKRNLLRRKEPSIW